jgi:hypothetical protein
MESVEENKAIKTSDGHGDGLSDHLMAVYRSPAGLDQALAALPLVESSSWGTNAPRRIGYLTWNSCPASASIPSRAIEL